MTDMVNVSEQTPVSNESMVKRQLRYEVDETYWGYIVRSSDVGGFGIALAQTISLFVGAALLASVLGLWIMPLNMSPADAVLMRTGMSILFVGFAILFLWFASRGTATELQIDTSLGELREVVRNRAGKSTLLGRYGFDSIGGVFLDRSAGGDMATLLLRYRNTAQTMYVTSGAEIDLITLRDRLGRDMVVGDGIARFSS